MERYMASSLKTTYFGHQISIEPAEWFLALVPSLLSVRLIAVSKSAMQALEGFRCHHDRIEPANNHRATASAARRKGSGVALGYAIVTTRP